MRTPTRTNTSRRRFMKLSASGLALIPVVHLAGCSDDSSSQSAAPAAPADTPAPPAAKAPATSAPAQPAPPPASAQAPASSPAELVELQENDPSAQALGYRHSAQDVDKAQYPRYEAGQICGNCNLYLPGAGPDSQWGGCSIFPGKYVSLNGWCNAYIAKA